MACKLDVDLVVKQVIEREIKNISFIENNFANTTIKFNKKDIELIVKLNKQWGEKVITYNSPIDNDVPGNITIFISEKLYDKYIKAIDKKRNVENTEKIREKLRKDAERAGVEYTDDYLFQKQTQSQEGIIASEKTIRDLAARMSDRIGIPVKYISDRSQYFKGKLENGIAVINLAYATLDTPIHEILGHAIIRALKNGNPQLYQNLLKELEYGKGKEVLDRVKRDYHLKNKPEIIKLESITGIGFDFEVNGKSFGTKAEAIKEQEKATTYYSIEEQQEEAIVELLGLMTAEKLDKVKDGKLISLLKRLLKEMKQFVRSLINQKEVEIDKLPDNMTLGDLSDLLAYSNSKLILPGYEVEYTTPDNNKFKTYQEASNHISELAKNVKDVDLSDVKLSDNLSLGNRDLIKYTYNDLDKLDNFFNNTNGYEYFKDDKGWYIIDENDREFEYFNGYFPKVYLENTKVLYDYNSSKYMEDTDFNEPYKLSFDDFVKALYTKSGGDSFIEKNKEYEQSKEIIEEWKKINNIVYNPEEVYSRGQGFYHSIGAYSNHDLELILQNILEHFKDNNLAGGTYDVSAFTKPTDKTIRHIEKSGVLIEIFPESKDINWASNVDVFSGSTLETHEKFSGSKLKKELAGVSESKYPSLSNINTIQPNLANIIDKLSHDHNELGITLTGKNFRFAINEKVLNTDTPNGLYWKVKKLVDANNKILDQKYGKLVKPEIKQSEIKKVTKFKVKGEPNIFNTREEAQALANKLSQLDFMSTYVVTTIQVEEQQGIQPTQTNETLKESIESVKSKYSNDVEDTDGLGSYGYDVNGVRYVSSDDGTYSKSTDGFKTWIEITKEEYEDNKPKKNIKEKEYTSQALINTKISKLKEVAKKYPRSLIRSEVRPIFGAFVGNDFYAFDKDELPFQKISKDTQELFYKIMNTPSRVIDEKIKTCL